MCFFTLEASFLEETNLYSDVNSIFKPLIEFYQEPLESKLTNLSTNIFNIIKFEEAEYKQSLGEKDIDFIHLNNIYHKLNYLLGFLNSSKRLVLLSSKLAIYCLYYLLINFKKENLVDFDKFNVNFFLFMKICENNFKKIFF